MQQFRYKKKWMYLNLVLGLLWLTTGFLNAFSEETEGAWWWYGYLIAGFLYLFIFLVQKKYSYIIFTSEEIIVKEIFSKRMKISNIKEIKYFAGDYTFKSSDKKIMIGTQRIDEKAVPELEAAIAKIKAQYQV